MVTRADDLLYFQWFLLFFNGIILCSWFVLTWGPWCHLGVAWGSRFIRASHARQAELAPQSNNWMLQRRTVCNPEWLIKVAPSAIQTALQRNNRRAENLITTHGHQMLRDNSTPSMPLNRISLGAHGVLIAYTWPGCTLGKYTSSCIKLLMVLKAYFKSY